MTKFTGLFEQFAALLLLAGMPIAAFGLAVAG